MAPPDRPVVSVPRKGCLQRVRVWLSDENIWADGVVIETHDENNVDVQYILGGRPCRRLFAASCIDATPSR